MRAYFLAACLLAAAPALAQAPKTPTGQDVPIGSIATLDAKNGFRKFTFGTPISQLPGWERRGRGVYVDPLEIRAIGDASLATLKFLTSQDKFSAVLLSTNGTANSERLLSILKAQYGPPTLIESNTKQWVGNRASILWKEATAYGLYGTSSTSVVVVIYSNDLYEAATDADLDKAEKTGTGL